MVWFVRNIISACWGVFFLVWLLAAIFTKRTVYRESAARRFRYLIPIVIGWYLVFRGHRLPYPFNIQIIPRPALFSLFLRSYAFADLASAFGHGLPLAATGAAQLP
jgi:membrane-bound metal-dependent hydrolase YbcI (DUF457 family)